MEGQTTEDSYQEVIKEIREGPGPVLLTIAEESKEISQTDSKSAASFSVLSYNILAEAYIGHFSSVIPEKYLNFSYRANIISEELRRFSSDIICLQEVDNFENFYKTKLEELGYHVLFAKRTNGAQDGVIVGAKKDTFDVLGHEILKFDEGHQFENSVEFKRGNVAIVAQLKHKISNEVVNFVGTHFYWDPKFEHVKYLQMHQIIQHVNSKLSEEDIVVWAGDLNSKPYCNALQFVLCGLPPAADKLESPKMEMIEPMQILYENLQKLQQKIKWGSVYENYGKANKDHPYKYPSYTTYTANFRATIDHMIYSKNTLIPKKLLKLPTEAEINDKALPNRRYPSDHLPLMAVFEVVKKS